MTSSASPPDEGKRIITENDAQLLSLLITNYTTRVLAPPKDGEPRYAFSLNHRSNHVLLWDCICKTTTEISTSQKQPPVGPRLLHWRNVLTDGMVQKSKDGGAP
jgi:hypothetical protein